MCILEIWTETKYRPDWHKDTAGIKIICFYHTEIGEITAILSQTSGWTPILTAHAIFSARSVVLVRDQLVQTVLNFLQKL